MSMQGLAMMDGEAVRFLPHAMHARQYILRAYLFMHEALSVKDGPRIVFCD